MAIVDDLGTSFTRYSGICGRFVGVGNGVLVQEVTFLSEYNVTRWQNYTTTSQPIIIAMTVHDTQITILSGKLTNFWRYYMISKAFPSL